MAAISPGDVISHAQMCSEEGISLQRGMNFRQRTGYSIILMSRRKNAPYKDRIEGEGRILIYEGHDVPRFGRHEPKELDQPQFTPSGKLTQNGLFYDAAKRYRDGKGDPEYVKVYEKLYTGIWVYNGIFSLVDAWYEQSGPRRVFKFRLELVEGSTPVITIPQDLAHNRLIPSAIKLAVWARDKGRCVKCGRTDNLHFDHILPFSKSGTSLTEENIQLLCVRHNLEKSDKIE